MKDTVASYPPVGSEYDSDLFNIQTLLWQPQTLQAFDVHSSSALNGSWAESGTDPNRLTFDTPLMDQITNASMTSPAISLDGPSPAKSFVTLENDPHNWNPLVNSLESNRCTFPKANNYSSSITPKCISKHRSSEKTLGASPSLEPLLHISARKGDCDVLRTLLKYRSDINMRDSNGRTALHVASEHGHQKAVSLLLRHGADVEALDLEGKSPLYLAVVASKNEVANVLLSYKY
ncbi:putative ankyrin repeat-containing protein [Botrytis fragariae]|uniref:Putative ankyrin repeat-containing protein n=1 Tax=Botrytis fragariae TaxID=1964551 RepID=A0A8H6B2L2_9HELO|nr:putative ankyrin repeat-containing protein [Botrytis fragariae]KAF5878020.1 putative ankyrin repeat-containing protein [Botrytis fragariae]